ncbi:delta-aminolevulinic acid dehydratase [Bacillus sp. 2CMS4F]|uniref:delta-aminolevulinic acid dehydratase n=1 Tax=Bacillus TaxID=1386 RepID=UPI0020C0E375|nr:delta-aminolevulinic acid dehydratase [Bacillus sp. 2CMS4F]MCK8100828.1 delta-aminolevulinic acid dehydratase [Bacillus sp. 2CMS4F]
MSQSSMCITLVAGPNCELESFALRSALEYYGAKVHMHWVGRPNDLVSVLSGENRGETDYLILSFHGEDGKFILPELGQDVYEKNEPRSCYFGPEEVRANADLRGVHVLATGCTLGDKRLAEAFRQCKSSSYIAPGDYIDGNATLIFVLTFIYELMTNAKSQEAAFQKAASIDKETSLFQLY